MVPADTAESGLGGTTHALVGTERTTGRSGGWTAKDRGVGGEFGTEA